jgi:hypothetical protein
MFAVLQIILAIHLCCTTLKTFNKEHEMQVTAATQTTEGKLYSLSNGDALLMKEITGCAGKALVYPVYVFANGRTYSARTGRFSHMTVVPACAAALRFERRVA